MNLDAPTVMTPVTINTGSDHYAARIIEVTRNGRTLHVMPEWAIIAAYLPRDFAIERLTEELTAVHAHEERTGRDAWHPYIQAALRPNCPYSPQIYTLRKDGRYRPLGATNYGTLTIGVAVNRLDPSF